MEAPRSARGNKHHHESPWDRTLDYFFFAERYRWTPEQVDALPLEAFNCLPDLAELVDEIHNEARERAAESSGRR